jgi:hypothetical protein
LSISSKQITHLQRKRIPFALIFQSLLDIETAPVRSRSKKAPATENRFVSYPYPFQSPLHEEYDTGQVSEKGDTEPFPWMKTLWQGTY